VLADVALITPSGRRVDIEDLEPPVEELADGGSGARIAFLIHLVQQPGAHLLGLVTGLRPWRYDLGEIHPPFEDRGHPAAHADAGGSEGQLVDAACRTGDASWTSTRFRN
jgi:hypothetical protein